jgi:hypothetical protein
MGGRSLNLCFEGKIMPDSEFPLPEGALLAKLFKAEFEKRSWKPSEIENWKDSGWEIGCLTADSKVSVSFAKEGDLWFLQVTPSKSPGWFARTMLKQQDSCTPMDLYKMAVEVDKIVKSYHGIGKFLWEWDRPPDEKTSVDYPTLPQ